MFVVIFAPEYESETMNIDFDSTALEELYYEKKKGDLKDVEAVWINDQYRLLFYSSPDEKGIVVNALLTDISKHYE